MTSDSDYLVDRRRMKRRLGWWRAAAFVAALVAIAGIALALGRDRLGGAGAHIARVEIKGFITGDDKTLDMLERVGKSDAAKAVIVDIDSPGGTVTGSEALFDALRALSQKKPTVAVVDGMAASGGYIAAMGTDRIVAQQTSLVGSIGVLFQYPNVVKLLDNVGVTVESVKSAPLKASPSPFEVTTPAAEQALRSLVVDTYDWFKRVVSERRSIAGGDLETVSDGRVFTGRQGLGLKLVDEIGNRKQAIAWLEKDKGIAKDLPVRDWKREDGTGFGLWSVAAGAASAAGLEDLARGIITAARGTDYAALDGLLAVWHP
jgi:protease-4